MSIEALQKANKASTAEEAKKIFTETMKLNEKITLVEAFLKDFTMNFDQFIEKNCDNVFNKADWEKAIQDKIAEITEAKQKKALSFSEKYKICLKNYKLKNGKVVVPNKFFGTLVNNAITRFKGRNALIFGGIGAGVLGLAGLITGLNRKNS